MRRLIIESPVPVLLWASMPCTGGSPWQSINWHKFGLATRDKILHHQILFGKIWESFELCAELCISSGGHIAIEWPRACKYWRFRQVVAFVKRHGLFKTVFDGCRYNLTSTTRKNYGMPIKKPWCIATTYKPLTTHLNLTCDGHHWTHATCQGSDTKNSERYTLEIVRAVHRAWSQV